MLGVPPTRILLIPALAGLLMGVILAGCTGGGKRAGTTIRFVAPDWPDEVKRLSGLIARFEKAHPGVRVEAIYTSDVRQKTLLLTTSGSPLDLVYLNDTEFPAFVSKGVFQPLDEFIRKDATFDLSDFYPTAIQCGTLRGKIYAVPPAYGTLPILYNKKLFDKAGVPYPKIGWTWEQFRDACRKLTIDRNRDGKPEQFGCVSMEVWFWLPMVFQNGGRIVDAGGKCVFNSQQVLSVLQLVKDMYNVDRVFVTQSTFPGAFSGGGRSLSEPSLFAGGKAAMIMTDMSVSKDFPPNLDWDIVSPPEKKGGRKCFHVGFWGYAMTSSSRNKQLTWELAKSLTSRQALEEWVQGVKLRKWQIMGVPARKSLADKVASLYPGKSMRAYTYCLQYPDFAQAQFLGTPAWRQAESKYNLSDVMFGRVNGDLKAVLDGLTTEINKTLARK